MHFSTFQPQNGENYRFYYPFVVINVVFRAFSKKYFQFVTYYIAMYLKKEIKKIQIFLCSIKKSLYFCNHKTDGSVAQLNRASDYGSEGYRFESCRSHKDCFIVSGLFFISPYRFFRQAIHHIATNSPPPPIPAMPTI